MLNLNTPTTLTDENGRVREVQTFCVHCGDDFTATNTPYNTDGNFLLADGKLLAEFEGEANCWEGPECDQCAKAGKGLEPSDYDYYQD